MNTQQLKPGVPTTIGALEQILGSVQPNTRNPGVSEYKNAGISNKSFVVRRGYPDLTELDKSTIIRVALQNPRASVVKITEFLVDQDPSYDDITPIVVRTVLSKANLDERAQKWEAIEALHRKGEILNAEQIDFVQRMNPIFAERDNEFGKVPGECILQDERFILVLNGEKAFIHFAIDTSSNYVWIRAHDKRQPEAAILLLHNEVLPYFEKSEFPLKKIVTSSSKTFWAQNMKHPYRVYAEMNPSITFEQVALRKFHENGYLIRIWDTLLSELLVRDMKSVQYDSIDALNADLAKWASEYNAKPHIGYPNYGNSPVELMK